MMQSPNRYETNSDTEAVPLRGQSMDDKLDVVVRHGFIKKVFGIVGIQLLVTTGIASLFKVYESAIRSSPAAMPLITLAMMMPMVLLCYSYCNPQVMREYPSNYFYIAAYTFCFGCIVGFSIIQFKTDSVLFVAGITAAIVLSLGLFAMQTQYDFSGAGPYLLCALVALCFTSFAASIAGSITGARNETLHVLISGFGALLFSFFIVYDVQLIAGGKHQQIRFGLDEYAFAALVLYMDIINLFLHLLSLLGERRN